MRALTGLAAGKGAGIFTGVVVKGFYDERVLVDSKTDYTIDQIKGSREIVFVLSQKHHKGSLGIFG
jgi:hypothetical protein